MPAQSLAPESVPAVPAFSTPGTPIGTNPHGVTSRARPPATDLSSFPTSSGPSESLGLLGQQTPRGQFEALLRLAGATKSGKKWQCPGHGLEGLHAHALDVDENRAGRLLLNCYAGCDVKAILDGFRLPYSALACALPVRAEVWYASMLYDLKFPAAKTASGSLASQGFRFEADHGYAHWKTPRDEVAWKMRYRHRSGAKEIRWESLNPAGERVPGLLGRRQDRLALYRQADIAMAIGAGETVTLAESESSVDALNSAGLYATTWCGGAGDPPISQLAYVLGEAKVLLVPDHDDAGLSYVEAIVEALPHARVQLGEPGEDARDILKRTGPEWFR